MIDTSFLSVTHKIELFSTALMSAARHDCYSYRCQRRSRRRCGGQALSKRIAGIFTDCTVHITLSEASR